MAMRRDPSRRHGIWSEDEHDRFLSAIKKFPQGPWSSIAELVGTRSVRQVQTHTQKYYEKIMRRMRGLRKDRKTWARLEHRIDDDILEFCDLMSQSSKASPALGPAATPPTGISIATGLANSDLATTCGLADGADSSYSTPVRETVAASFLTVSPRDVSVKREADVDMDKDAVGCYITACDRPFLLDMDALDAMDLTASFSGEVKELPTLEESLDFLIEAMDA